MPNRAEVLQQSTNHMFTPAFRPYIPSCKTESDSPNGTPLYPKFGVRETTFWVQIRGYSKLFITIH